MLDHTLLIRRGAPFHAHAWPLTEYPGGPWLRESDGLAVVGKMRAYPRAHDAVVLSTSLVMLSVAGQFDNQPVVAAQLNAMTAEQTAAWFDFSGHLWELAVGGAAIVGGLVDSPWAVSR